MNNFLYLEKFLSRLDDIYSVIDVDFSLPNLTPVKLLNDEKLINNYTPVYLKSSFSNEIRHEDGIFQHSSNFYIYLSRNLNNSEFEIKIIYKTEQYEEIKMFLNNLKKIK